MKKGKIILTFLLIMTMMLPLVACTKDSEGDPDDSSGNATNESDTTPGADDQKRMIVCNNAAEYEVVYPENSSSKLQKEVGTFISQIGNETGVMLKSRTVDTGKAQSFDSKTKEILIGDTGYSETKEVLEGLGENDWSIVGKGNKIVITAHSEALVIEALKYYEKNLIKNNLKITEGKRTLYFESYEYKEQVAKMSFNHNEIKNYKIIYASEPAGLEVAADNLKNFIQNTYDVRLPVGKDTTIEEHEYEILIGNTNRAASRNYYRDHKVPLMSFKAVVEGKKTLFICGGACSAGDLVTNFQFTYGNKEMDFEDGEYLAKNMLELDDQPLTSGSTMRVMTSNILADRWATEKRAPVAQRAEMYAAMLAVYHPDMIGVQETDAPWQKVFPYYLDILNKDYKLGYEWIHRTEENLPNLTTIIYRADKYRLLESDVQSFSYSATTEKIYKLRVLTWAVFEEISDGTKYALVNTHWSGKVSDNEIEIPTEVELINKICNRYKGIHLFCTGDFNLHMNNGFEKFKKASGLVDSKEAAQKNGCLVNELPGIPEGIYIDHVFINEGATVTRYETIDKNYASVMSDHLLQYGDYRINK